MKLEGAGLISAIGPDSGGTNVCQMAQGATRLLVDGGKLRAISFAGTEVIRAISAPVRDENWGTLAEQTISEDVESKPGEVVWRRVYHVGDGQLEGEMLAVLREDALDVHLRLTPRRAMRVNRAGFCLLHPLAGVEGQMLAIRHPDGRASETRFPVLIQPDQPAKSIAGLKHRVGAVSVEFEFEGDVFEMEDQRNWSDASYKTYCRPLHLPFPYELSAGQSVVQRVLARFKPSGDGAKPRASAEEASSLAMPEVLLAVEPGWWGGSVPKGAGLLLRMGEGMAWSEKQLAAIASARATVDLECVLPDDRDPAETLGEIRRLLTSAGIAPRHVAALPQAYLKSHQPTGPWPAGISPRTAADAAAEQFAGARLGIGVFTNFTELNRCRPASGVGGYVSHGNSAIVHEADDLSVWQTLEALPSVFSSAKAIGGTRGYRLGLCAIAMRSNPYGAALSPNPGGALRTMTADDPRQCTSFAAAYAIAVLVLAAKAGAEAIALAAPLGPFGLEGAGGPWPIHAAVSALASIGRQRANVSIDAGLAIVQSGEILICANASPKAREHEATAASRLWDGRRETRAPQGKTEIPPGGVLISLGGAA
jgi:D-apionolactonase